MGKSFKKLTGLCCIIIFEHRYELVTVLKHFKEQLHVIYLCTEHITREGALLREGMFSRRV